MKAQDQPADSARSLLDVASGTISLICMAHCLALPLALTLAPTLSVALLDEGPFHMLMLVLVLPTSVVALCLGCRRHKQLPVALLGAAGLTVLFFTAFFGHDLFGLLGERVATSLGGLLLALAHWQNFSACRRASCSHQ